MQPEVRSGLITLLIQVLPLPQTSTSSSTTHSAVTAIVASLESLLVQLQSMRQQSTANTNSWRSSNDTGAQSYLTDALAHRIGTAFRKLNAILSSIYGGTSVNITLANLDSSLAEITTALDRHTEEIHNETMKQQPAVVDLKGAFIQRELLHEKLQLELQVNS